MRFSLHEPRGRRDPASALDAGADDVLCYMDQGSFVGLRALGRGPVLQLTWLYAQAIDDAAVTAFGERLAQGLLGRLIQRSPLPWGRHRWVRSPAASPVEWFRDPIPRDRLPRLRRELLDRSVDPERGPGWRLLVQALEGGGSALTLLVSHTIGDLLAVSNAVADAVAGRKPDHGFPAPSRRWSPLMLARDGVESLRAVPAVCRAVLALARRSRKAGANPPRSREHGDRDPFEPVVDVPLLHVIIDPQAYQKRPSGIGVTGNTLVMAFAARLAFRLGRVDASGRVKLVLPVSDRRPGDRRGNALRSITVMADPDVCGNDPHALQRDLKAALASLLRNGDDFSPLFPLIPYVPLWLARRLERNAIGDGLDVGCSLAGQLPPEVHRPCGGEALALRVSLLERYTASDLERLGGLLFVVCHRLGERLFCSVSAYMPGRATSREELMPFVRHALSDMGLAGTID